jgi:hypothetical protein
MPMTQTLDGSGATLIHGVPTWVQSGVNDAPLDTISIEEDEVGPQPGDNVSHPVLRPKLDAHHMYARDQVVIHTSRM